VAPIDGLYLNFAVICEKVLREADDVLSFIRVIDQLTVTIVAPPGVDVPSELSSAPPVSLTFAIGLKSDGYAGPVPVRLWNLGWYVAELEVPEDAVASRAESGHVGLSGLTPRQLLGMVQNVRRVDEV